MVDYEKVMHELDNVLADECYFSLTKTHFDESIDIVLDGIKMTVFWSEEDPCETNGDVIMSVRRNMGLLAHMIETVREDIIDTISTSDFYYTSCPYCGESDDYRVITIVNGFDTVSCGVCGNYYRR